MIFRCFRLFAAFLLFLFLIWSTFGGFKPRCEERQPNEQRIEEQLLKQKDSGIILDDGAPI